MSDGDFSDFEEDGARNTAAAMDSKRHARAQHNALERRRRDNIKDMYGALKDAIPGMKSERASRAAVLKKAIDLITTKQSDLEKILSENQRLEEENNALEREMERLQQAAALRIPHSISDEGSGCRNEAITGAEAAPMGDELKLPSYLALPNRKRPAPADEQSDLTRNI